MYLSIHAAAGVLIGTYTAQPFIAFVLGLFSHFILDAIPHYDGNIELKGHTLKTLNATQSNKLINLLIIEIILGVSAILMLYHQHPLLTPTIFWAVSGSILPDIFQFLLLLSPGNTFLRWFDDLHQGIHYQSKNPVAPIVGLTIQLITFIAILIPIIYTI